MTQAEEIKQRLEKYYSEVGIDPSAFACKYCKECCPGNFARGMQCHVGSKYGERTRILVASLDCGSGGADTIKNRTDNVVKGAAGNLNPHMRGTYLALSYFWGETSPSELVHYMIMINTCKCCREDSSDQMDYNNFWYCKEYKIEEISIAAPQIILFQGKNSLVGCEDKLSDINDDKCDKAINEYLKYYNYNGKKCYAVKCIHPSARGRHYTKRVAFYEETLPQIAKYIKEHPLKP